MDYSVLILTKNEADNLQSLLPQLQEVLNSEGVSYEIIVVDAHSQDRTATVASQLGAYVYDQKGLGYGAAFREGLSYCQGELILTIDADHSHPPQFVRTMLANKLDADLLIASRYVPGDRRICLSIDISLARLSILFFLSHFLFQFRIRPAAIACIDVAY